MNVKLFDTINYLKTGTLRQQQSYSVLKDNNVMDCLQQYNPILAGTIPLAIDIQGSDLDILCHYADRDSFIKSVQNAFSESGILDYAN